MKKYVKAGTGDTTAQENIDYINKKYGVSKHDVWLAIQLLGTHNRKKLIVHLIAMQLIHLKQ
jgi:hypothetical protein